MRVAPVAGDGSLLTASAWLGHLVADDLVGRSLENLVCHLSSQVTDTEWAGVASLTRIAPIIGWG
jgi:hypothetical protein